MAALTQIPKFNDHAKESFFKHAEDYLFSGEGAYRVLALGKSGLALVAEAFKIGGRSLPAVQEASEVFATGAAGLAIPQAGALTISAARAMVALPKFTQISRSIIFDCFQKITDSVSTSIAAIGLFVTSGPVMRIAGDVFGALADAGDAAIAADRLSGLKEANVRDISDDVKKAVREERTLFWIKTAKAVTAVAGGVLGVMGLVLGTALVSSLFLLVLSVTSSAFAVGKYFYDKNRTYNDDQLIEKIKQFNLKPVQA